MRPGTHAAAVGDQDFHVQLGIDLGEDPRREFDAGHHALLAHRHERAGAAVFRDEIAGSDIAVADVFGERECR